MIHLHPFRAVRPRPEMVEKIVTKSYFTYPEEEIQHLLKTNPHSFFSNIYPALPIYPEKENLRKRYEEVRKRYLRAKDEGLFLKESTPAFYYYRQENKYGTYEGVIGVVSVKDYQQGMILKHEKTLSEREKRLTQYLEVVRINAEPVLLIEEQNRQWEEKLRSITANEPLYDFAFNEDERHTLWAFPQEWIEPIQSYYLRQDYLYIGDGHHRVQASLRYALNRGISDPLAPYCFFLACIVQEQKVKVWEFNRIVSVPDSFDFSYFLHQLKENFIVFDGDSGGELSHGCFRIYYRDQCYTLRLRDKLISNSGNPVEELDATLLTRYVFEPYLHITDLRTDRRVEFVAGDQGIDSLKSAVKDGLKLAFQLPKPSLSQLKRIALNGETMPPKTTWLLPKMLSGFTIFELDQ